MPHLHVGESSSRALRQRYGLVGIGGIIAAAGLSCANDGAGSSSVLDGGARDNTSLTSDSGQVGAASGGGSPVAASDGAGATVAIGSLGSHDGGTGGQVGSGGASSSLGGGNIGSDAGTGASKGGALGTGGKTGPSLGVGGKAGAGGSAGIGGKAGAGGSHGTGGLSLSADGGRATIPTHCTSDLPAGAQAVDVSNPASVIGTGTPESCTFDALRAAVRKGGIITFRCGPNPHAIPIDGTMELPTDKDTVIDGGGTITLDGQSSVQILNFNHEDWMKNETRVTLQHLRFINAKTNPTEVIPTATPPCSQGYNDGEGGALFMRDGNLTVIDCTFEGNQAAPRGPDTGGGAIYINGSKHGALIVGSVFINNSASNAGAIGGLFATLEIYDSLFRDNKATGDGANSDDDSKCDAINNGQHEVGSGGNGGAIYQDGAKATNVLLCGVDVENNAAGAGAFGGGVFMTSNDFSGSITVKDSVITGNSGGHWTQVNQGSDLGTAFGVNAKSSSIENSTLQK